MVIKVTYFKFSALGKWKLYISLEDWEQQTEC